jgi:hypothetical protein
MHSSCIGLCKMGSEMAIQSRPLVCLGLTEHPAADSASLCSGASGSTGRSSTSIDRSYDVLVS